MTLEQCEKMIGKLCATFPQTTREQSKTAAKALVRFSAKTAAAAIEEHATRFEFLTLSDLVKTCERLERAPDTAGRAAIPDQSYADIVRAQDPQLANVKGDVEVILRNYRKQWHACGQRAEYRAMMKRQCATALLTGARIDGASFTPAVAEDWAEVIFADVPTMKAVLDDLRSNHTSGPAPKQDDAAPWRQSTDGIRDHFETAWQAVYAGCDDEHGRSVARVTILRHAITALLAMSIDGQRMEVRDVDEMARAFVGLKPGERVPWPHAHFATQIEVERPATSFDAVKDLARHEEAIKALPAPEVSEAFAMK